MPNISRPKIILFIILLVLLVCFSLVVLYLTGKITNSGDRNEKGTAGENSTDMKWGISGYTPANFPSSNTAELQEYWDEIGTYTDIYGVHTDWSDIRIVKTAALNYSGEISVVLGYQDPEEWQSSREEYMETLREALKTDNNIKYLAIGNEVNLLYEKYPKEFQKFVSDYKYFYEELKKIDPDLIVYTTFNYESLIGEGYLFGSSISHRSNVDLLQMFNGYLDIVGITVYPYMDYASVSDIPSDYFSPISSYGKDIAITETGWMARERYGEGLKSIDTRRLSGSESEQAEYLEWLTKLDNSVNLVFINWIFLNDPYSWKNGVDPNNYELFDSIALKYHDGEPKKVWDEWKKLFE